MNSETQNLNIAHLYPELLNTYGDWGNVLTLKKRCEWRNIGINIDTINLGDTIDINKYDIYFLGGGQDQQQAIVANELQKHKTQLLEARDNNSIFLGICGGYQLLGHYYQLDDKTKLNGIGLLNTISFASQTRFIGNVTTCCNFIKPNTLVGFENHNGTTFLDGETQPLAKIIVGKGNNNKDNTEGARYKNVFGTYLHGPLLPKNPHFADYLIKLALEKKYQTNINLTILNDDFEVNAHQSVINKKY